MRHDPLLHPATLFAMALLAVNDHWAKHALTGVVTGKLSDFAGLVFFPLLLELLPLGAARQRRRLAVLATGLGFALVKTMPAVTASWNEVFGAVYRSAGWAQSARLVCDPTDLIALFALVIPLTLLPLRSLDIDLEAP
ncbi:MAG: hypothetical protein ACI8S6_004241 [Myxococcota bacterium]|jgi:hypothetical protein